MFMMRGLKRHQIISRIGWITCIHLGLSQQKAQIRKIGIVGQSTGKLMSFKRKAIVAKKNCGRNGKGMVNHTGGLQTFEVTLERMTVYLAKEKEALSQLQLEAQAIGSSVPTKLPKSQKATLFKEAAGGEKKGEVYGSGSASSHFYTLERKDSSSSSMAGISSSVDVVEFQQNILQLEKTLMEEREERKAAEVRTYKMVKQMLANNKQRRNDDDNTEDDDDTVERMMTMTPLTMTFDVSVLVYALWLVFYR